VKSPDSSKGGGKFNESRPQSDVEVRIRRASAIPGPGQYVLPDNKLSGGKFNQSNPKSDIDVRVYTAAQIPGPSDYTVKDDIVRQSSHTGKFPFVYRPPDQNSVGLKKFATAVNAIRTMNRFKDISALAKAKDSNNEPMLSPSESKTDVEPMLSPSESKTDVEPMLSPSESKTDVEPILSPSESESK
jgi:hypothetical protein